MIEAPSEAERRSSKNMQGQQIAHILMNPE